MRYLLAKGVSRDKLIVGIATYGNAFTLASQGNNKVGARAKGNGSMKFSTICKRVQAGVYNDFWENAQKVPYALKGSYWIGYEYIRSVTEKAHNINSMNLGGAMFWSLDSDDFSNNCRYGKFPLISSVKRIVAP